MIEQRRASDFLLSSAGHRQWAERARRVSRPDLARHHNQLARAIERLEERDASDDRRQTANRADVVRVRSRVHSSRDLPNGVSWED